MDGRQDLRVAQPLALFAPRRVVAWVGVGLAASLVELGLLKLLYEGASWPLPIATALAAEVLILVKFGVSDRWVFARTGSGIARLLRYHGASAGAFVVYWLVINGLAAWLDVPYALAFVVGTAAAFVWSLITNFLWVWAP